MRRTILVPLIALALAVPGCGERQADDGRPLVVTTTGMIGWLAGEIAGDNARVVSLMGPGVDPHLYKASGGDVRRFDEADLILYNGLHLEGKMVGILEKMSRRRPVVALADSLPADLLLALPGEAVYDPHIWFDVSLWARTVPVVERALAAVDPTGAGAYREAAARVTDELVSLDGWVAARIAAIPERQRVLVTAHDAFGYFGERYGLAVEGLQGVSTVTEAGLQDMDRLVDLIAGRGIKAIFVESSVPRRAIESVQAACADRGHAVAIGGELFSDAMGAAGTPEGAYPGMVRHNVNTIVEALR